MNDPDDAWNGIDVTVVRSDAFEAGGIQAAPDLTCVFIGDRTVVRSDGSVGCSRSRTERDHVMVAAESTKFCRSQIVTI